MARSRNPSVYGRDAILKRVVLSVHIHMRDVDVCVFVVFAYVFLCSRVWLLRACFAEKQQFGPRAEKTAEKLANKLHAHETRNMRTQHAQRSTLNERLKNLKCVTNTEHEHEHGALCSLW